MSDTQEQFTEEELLDMTDEERIAVESEIDEGPESVISEDDNEDLDAAGAVDTPVQPEDTGENTAENTPTAAFQFPVGNAKEIAEKLAEFDVKERDIDNALDEGDIGIQEYKDQLKALEVDRRSTQTEQIKLQLAEEHNKLAADQLWQKEQAAFLDSHAEYKLNTLRMGALQSAIHTLDAAGGPPKSGADILIAAHTMVTDAFGGSVPQNTKTAKVESGTKPLAGKQPKDTKSNRDKVTIPATLGGLPLAEANDSGGEFAFLDRLSGAAFEKALEKLSADQQDRYLRG